MKPSLKGGIAFSKAVKIDEGRCISFMGREGMVYATPHMVSDVEYACRDWLVQHLDEGEDSVGAHVTIDHLAPTPLGLTVTIDVEIREVEKRKVLFAFSVKDVEEVGRGTHVRFIVDKAKTFERLKAKKQKAGAPG